LNNPRQVIHIFSKYENILKRQKIKDNLKVECDQLYQSVVSFLKSLNAAMADTKSEGDDNEITPIVSDIKWFKMIEYQLIQINQITDNVLTDHENYGELKKSLAEFQSDLDSQIKINFEKWCENSLSAVMSGELV
jgi:dynein heavy chain 2